MDSKLTTMLLLLAVVSLGACQPGIQAEAVAKLGEFAGAWKHTFISPLPTVEGKEQEYTVSMTTTTIEVDEQGSLNFSFDIVLKSDTIWTPDGTISIPKSTRCEVSIKPDTSTGTHIMTLESKSWLNSEAFPLSYDKDKGFSGETAIEFDGQAYDLKVEIASEEGGEHTWSFKAFTASGEEAFSSVHTFEHAPEESDEGDPQAS